MTSSRDSSSFIHNMVIYLFNID